MFGQMKSKTHKTGNTCKTGKILMGAALMAGMMAGLMTGAAQAQGKGLGVELNTTLPGEGGCALLFVADNQTKADFAAFHLDMSVYDRDKKIAGFYRMGFADIAGGAKSTVQFRLDGLDCEEISAVTVNPGPLGGCTTKAEGDAEACAAAPSLAAGPDLGFDFD